MARGLHKCGIMASQNFFPLHEETGLKGPFAMDFKVRHISVT